VQHLGHEVGERPRLDDEGDFGLVVVETRVVRVVPCQLDGGDALEGFGKPGCQADAEDGGVVGHEAGEAPSGGYRLVSFLSSGD
jgi:hypothetical protein